jgi:hypothetical protein
MADWRHRGWVVVRTVTAVLALALVATAGAFATPAVSARAGEVAHIVDRTYTCRVRPERYVDINTNVALPAAGSGHPTLAQVWLDTVHKTAPVGGILAVVPQVEFETTKNSLRVDTSLCRHSSRRIALKPAGLPLYETATPTVFGHVDERCATPKRVLVRFRIEMQHAAPRQALFAVRNGDAKGRPVEFIKWRPRKVSAYAGKSCTDTG